MRCLAGLACGLMLWVSLCSAHPGRGIVVDAQGNVYLADATRSVVWKIDGSGQLSAVAREVHAHWIALDDAGRVLADDVRYEDGKFVRGLVRLSGAGRIDTLITHAADPDGLDAGAFAWISGRLAIARDSQSSLDWWAEDGRHPGFRLPIAGDTVNSLIAQDGGGLAALRGRQLLAISDHGDIRLMADVPLTDSKRLLDLKALWGLAAGEDGAVFTTDPGLRQVLRIDRDGHIQIVDTSQPPWFPTGVAWHQGQLLILEHGLYAGQNLGPRVRMADPATGRILATVE